MVGGIFQRFLLRKTPLHRFGIEHALSSSSGGSQATGTPCKEVGGGQVFSISEFRKFHVTPLERKTNGRTMAVRHHGGIRIFAVQQLTMKACGTALKTSGRSLTRNKTRMGMACVVCHEQNRASRGFGYRCVNQSQLPPFALSGVETTGRAFLRPSQMSPCSVRTVIFYTGNN